MQFSLIPLFVFLSITVMLGTLQANQHNRPLVDLPCGKLQGKEKFSIRGNKFYSFEGIPYAEPPIGNLRFSDPSAALPWKGIWDASEPASMCFQLEQIYPPKCHILGSEDCLYLNVYTPWLPNLEEGENSTLPVLVYFHSGGFSFGSGQDYGPRQIVDRNIILVTLNYRLGIFGFLHTGDGVISGNLGLKDQVLALKWVQLYIPYFGGNSSSVTILGLGAGGASVHFHMLSDMSEGLFHRAISLAGSAITKWGQRYKSEGTAFLLGNHLGCKADTSHQLIKCLRSRSATTISSRILSFQPWHFKIFTDFAPNIEISIHFPFINTDSELLLKEGKQKGIPWLVGSTNASGTHHAGGFLSNSSALRELQCNFKKLAPHLLHYGTMYPVKAWDQIGNEILNEYFEGKPINMEEDHKLVKMATDGIYDAALVKSIELAKTSSTIYYYRFNYASKTFQTPGKRYGAHFGDDLAYVLNSPNRDVTGSKEDSVMSVLMLDLFEGFIKTSDPNGGPRSFSWTPVNESLDTLNYLTINHPNEYFMESNENVGNYKFWEKLYTNNIAV